MNASCALGPGAQARLLSDRWFLLSELKPALHAQTPIQRQVQRGQVWQVLTGPDGRRHFRLNAPVWCFLARCNGQRSVQQLWDWALKECGNDTPTQDELLSILARLHQAGLLSFDRRPDFASAAEGAESAGDQDPQRKNSLLAWRLPFGKPDAWMHKLANSLPNIAGPRGWLLFVAFMLVVVLAAVSHAGQWMHQLQHVLAAPRNWGLMFLVYLLLKLLHEVAHGLAARRCGAPVVEWGVSLLMFMPVPYVDVSAASALPRRRQRMLVAGAGMLAETAVAQLAFLMWLGLQAGPASDAALLVFFTAGLSTILVNGNPLLRFDGYHLLSDAFNLPNLATRSARYVLQGLARAWGLQPAQPSLTPAAGEAPWLWCYAPAALLMRWTVAAAVVLWLGSLSQQLGWLVALLLAWQMLWVPGLKFMRWWRRLDKRHAVSARRMAVTVPGLLLCLLGMVPLPVSTVAQGMLWLPEHALVRSQASGMVLRVLSQDGQRVQAGDVVLQLVSPQAKAHVDSLQARAHELQGEEQRLLLHEPAQAMQVAHRLQATLQELREAEARLGELNVRAPSAGRLVINQASDLPGRYLKRGELVAHVLTGEAGIVRLAVGHDSAARIASQASPDGQAQPIAVRSMDGDQPPRTARWLGGLSGGVTALPSAALGDRSGGRLATDAADPQGLKPAQRVLVGELQLDGAAAHRLGERVLVRFENGSAPLFQQLARKLQQQVLHHFNPHS